MSKIILYIGALILGFFIVLILNNKTPQQTQSNLIPTPSPSPALTPIPTAILETGATTSAQTENENINAVIRTARGKITLTLYSKETPNTVANFVQKAKSGFYNNLIFHRVEDWVVQGGDPLGNGTGGGKMTTELNNKPFVIGSLGVARGQDIKISNDAQFFITKTDASWLNGQYTNFGIVTSGMNVVNNLQIADKILGITIE